jgi:putative membrane protein
VEVKLLKGKFNVNEFIWFAILVGFSYYFYKLIYTGKLSYFIHPKMFKYCYFAVFALALMAVYQLSDVFTQSSHMKIKYGYLLFIFVLFLGFVISPKGLNAQAALNRGIYSLDRRINTGDNRNEDIEKKTPVKRIPRGSVEVNEKNYMQVLNEIHNNLDSYEGKSITITGFVYREASFDSKNFVAARMLVNCCAADAEVVGYLCKYNNKLQFPKGQWVKVTGVIDRTEIEHEDKGKKTVPVIDVLKVTRISEPDNKYVYE